ncbi:CRAL-TRIO domain-containing protein [Dichotomocladium elegans]|nr:CRAL-TRIO domain-containing protein [Dichotomocladium elegans]
MNKQKAAKNQLLAMINWRKENKIDLLPVATRENQLPLLYPIRGFSTIPDGNLEASRGVSESVLRINRWMGEEVNNYHIGCNEFLHRVIMRDCSITANRTINRETVIFDCTGMGWHQFHMPALQFIRAISDVDQKYYPETLNKLYLVNAPSAFVMVWKIVKGWLDPGTINKIQILGKDFQSTLLEQIPAENLPTFLGGKCVCAHMQGGCVPSQVLKNIPVVDPQPHNEKTSSVYNTDIMIKSETEELFRGPSTTRTSSSP